MDTHGALGVDSAYKIVLSDDPDELAAAVEKLISEGWTPLGGVAIAFDRRQLPQPGKVACAQAMLHHSPFATLASPLEESPTMPTANLLPKYVCHKEVRALQITEVEWIGADQRYMLHFAGTSGFEPVAVPKEWVDSKGPRAGGYYVVYQDGYASFSPQKAFEEGYTLVPE